MRDGDRSADRTDPAKGTIDIFFAYFPHRDPGPASSAILVTEGGPGFSVTQDPFIGPFYCETFDPLMDTRDLILLDQRGVGRSGAIDCRRLQDGGRHLRAAVRACGALLGPAASLYASDNVALDIEAVRAALGIDTLDFYGGSNAAQDIQAYAARFPEHLRSAVLDTPNTTLGFGPFDPISSGGRLRAARLLCARSLSCAAEHRNAAKAATWLARRLRRHPVTGVGLDANRRPHRVRVTEGFLIWNLFGNDGGGYAAPSEIGAAAEALRHGDRAPLLRLAAENSNPFFGDEGDPTQFSVGDNFARFCTDNPMPRDKSAPRATRKAQYEAARAALPNDAFAPFSIDGWLAPLPTGPLGPDVCIDWPAPDREIPPPIPPGAVLSGDVPALILAADLDLSTVTELARTINRAWPNSRLVKIANSGHHAAVNSRSECADAIIVDFIDDLEAQDTGCASQVMPLFPAVGRFAATAGQARKAQRSQGDRSTATDRSIATVAAATVTDAFRRAFIQDESGSGPGLRGGTFESRFTGDATVIEYDRARFAGNVAISGRARYGFEDEVINARIKVRGPRGERGHLRISGAWFAFFSEASSFTVRGKLGGHKVAVRVPAS